MSYSDKGHKRLHALDHSINNAVADFHIPDEDKKSPENRSTTNFTVSFIIHYSSLLSYSFQFLRNSYSNNFHCFK